MTPGTSGCLLRWYLEHGMGHCNS